MAALKEATSKEATGTEQPVSSATGRRRSRIRTFLVNIGLIVLSSLVTLGVLEVVFRAFFPQPLYAVQYAPWGFAHIPSTEFWHGSHAWMEGRWLNGTEYLTHIQYNTKGYREYERDYAKPPGTLRILVLGDSYGEGMEVQFEETAAKRLEQQLNVWLASGAATAASLLPAPALRDQSVGGSLPVGQATAVSSEALPVELAGIAGKQARDDWSATRPIFQQLQADTAAANAKLLVANVHYRDEQYRARQEFLEGIGANLVDVSSDLNDPANRSRLHYRYDGHWNAAGHARAADLIAQKIVSDRLLPITQDTQRIETINTSMSAYSTCKELMLFEADGVKYEPDLVLVIYTAADDRNTADSALCNVQPDGRIVVQPAAFSRNQEILRTVKGYVKSHSHFLTFVLDRLGRIDAVGRWNFQFEDQYRAQNVPVD